MNGFFSRKYAAEILGVSYITLMNLEKKKLIFPFRDKSNQRPLYTQEVIDEYLKKLKESKYE